MAGTQYHCRGWSDSPAGVELIQTVGETISAWHMCTVLEDMDDEQEKLQVL